MGKNIEQIHIMLFAVIYLTIRNKNIGAITYILGHCYFIYKKKELDYIIGFLEYLLRCPTYELNILKNVVCYL